MPYDPYKKSSYFRGKRDNVILSSGKIILGLIGVLIFSGSTSWFLVANLSSLITNPQVQKAFFFLLLLGGFIWGGAVAIKNYIVSFKENMIDSNADWSE